MNQNHFHNLVIEPTLKLLGMESKAASQLLLMTAIHESRLLYLTQLGGGPAISLYQIEPTTYHDIYTSYLSYKPDLRKKVSMLAGRKNDHLPWPDDEELITNLAFATAIARMVYYRQPDPMPEFNDHQGMAEMWKKVYNTHKGKGTVEAFLKSQDRQYLLNPGN
jgi:hypothetical protein